MGNSQAAAMLLVRLVIGVTMVAHGYNHWRGGGRIAGEGQRARRAGAAGGNMTGWRHDRLAVTATTRTVP